MSKNKKKYIIATIAFLICSVMFFLAIKAERMYANNVTKQETNTEVSQSKSTDSKNTLKMSEESKKVTDENNTSNESSKNTATNTSSSSQSSVNTDSQENKSNTAASKSSESSNGETTSKEQEATVKQSVQTPNPDEEPTFMVVDTVHGDKVILQKHFDMQGETVGYITCKILDEAKIKFRTTGSSSTLYVAAIDGVEEKKSGPLSGWCYYVKKKGEADFHKPNVGCGQYVYEKGDVVLWKYLADGIHDK